jgi:hypothetical protein
MCHVAVQQIAALNDTVNRNSRVCHTRCLSARLDCPLDCGYFGLDVVPERAWQKVAADLFAFKGCDYLLAVDYYR